MALFWIIVGVTINFDADAQKICTYAGTFNSGWDGDGSPATSSSVKISTGALASNGYKLIIASPYFCAIRKVIFSTDIITTVAGNGVTTLGSASFSHIDGGYSVSLPGVTATGTGTTIGRPTGVAIDNNGYVYFSLSVFQCICRIDTTTNVIDIIAGNGTSGYTGDGAMATDAELNNPTYLAFDNNGNLYVSDNGNNVVRQITFSSPGVPNTINTIAGNATSGYSGDGYASTLAELHSPQGLAFDASGNLYIADKGNNVIRQVAAGSTAGTFGNISTYAGTGTAGYSTSGTVAASANMNGPTGLAFNHGTIDTLYFSDISNNMVRRIYSNGSSVNVYDYVGNGTAGYAGDCDDYSSFTTSSSGSVELYQPTGVAFSNGVLFISDGYPGETEGNTLVRAVVPDVTITPASPAPVCAGGSVVLTANFPLLCSYQWYNSAGSISGATNATYTATTSDNYYVTISTGATVSSTSPYTSPCSSSSNTVAVTISTPPAAITPPSAPLCSLATTTLVETVAGGTWSSSSSSIATVSSSGVVTGGATNGLATISYTTAGCAPATAVISVTAAPAAIGGTFIICEGASTTLTDPTLYGTWSTGGSAIASIDAITGVITASTTSMGSAIVTYTTVCGIATQTISVTGTPAAIGGTFIICEGSSTTLTDPTLYGTWSTGGSAIASITGTGVVTGSSSITGITTVTYTTVCGSTTHAFSVTAAPAAISSTSTILCSSGMTTTLSESVPFGTWSSSGGAATFSSATGIVTATSDGIETISYTTVCGTQTISIVSTERPGPIGGAPASLCAGATATLTDPVTVGGSWNVSGGAATIGAATGILTGSTGTTTPTPVTVTYSTGCAPDRTTSVMINPSAGPITGTPPSPMCVGATAPLHDAIPSGTWTSSSTAIAAVGTSSGIVTAGATMGIATITYTIFGCPPATTQISVTAAPAGIMGGEMVCTGASITLTDATPFGVWSYTDIWGDISIGATTGIVTGVAVGSVSVSYTTGCGTPATFLVEVTTSPSTITGSGFVCVGSTTTLSDAAPYGIWSLPAGTSSIATIGMSSGILSGLSPVSGLLVTYSTGCGAPITRPVAVLASPVAITGPTLVCVGSAITLSDLGVPSGTWSITSGAGYATIDPVSGILLGTAVGPVTIQYSTGCGTPAVYHVNVSDIPGAITGPGGVCVIGSITLADPVPGGTWSQIDLGPAYSAIDETTGVLTGYYPGTVLISYTTGCGSPVGTSIIIDDGPTLVANPAEIFCTAISVGVTATSAFSSTYTYLWTPAPGTTISTPTSETSSVTGMSVGLNLFNVTVTDMYGCAANATDTIVVANTSDCTGPCGTYRYITTPLGLTGSIGSPGTTTIIGPGDYYIDGAVTSTGAVTIYGNVIMNDAVVMIYPGPAFFGNPIKVDPKSSLTLNGCHLFTNCDIRWTGIVLETDGGGSVPATSTGIVTLQGDAERNSTLIENAWYAIGVGAPFAPEGGNPYYINCNNAIINQADIGVGIGNYTPATPTTYEFNFQNTVFCQRDFSSYSKSGIFYPFAWPNTMGTTGLKTTGLYTPTDNYSHPYNIDNPNAGGTGIAYPYSSSGAYAAIDVQYVGAPVVSSTYPGILIGNSSADPGNANLCLIDHFEFGIYALNTNIKVQNCAFIKTANAIHATATTVGQYKIDVEPAASTGYGTAPNKFYNCVSGIYSTGYYDITGNGNSFITNYGVGTVEFPFTYPYFTSANQVYAYNFQSPAYDNVSFSNNNITNIANGISFVSTTYLLSSHSGLLSAPIQYAGPITANGNTINAVSGSDPVTGQYCNFGISLQNVVNNYGPPYFYVGGSAAGNVTTNNNNIYNTFHGIYVGSYWKQQVFTQNNNISIFGTHAVGQQFCFGINHTDCAKDIISNNGVVGACTSCTNTPMVDSAKAIYVSTSSQPQVVCNQTIGIGRGFEFFHNDPGTQWNNNTMNDNKIGYVINNSIIGQQGFDGEQIANNWVGSWGSGGYPFHSFVAAAPSAVATCDAKHSKLFLAHTSTTYPINNGTNAFDADYTTETYGCTSDCALNATYPGGVFNCSTLAYHFFHVSPFEDFATRIITYPAGDYMGWMGQMEDWQTAILDSGLIDSSVVMDSFYTHAANSRFAYLTALESVLAMGDTTTADSLFANPLSPLAPYGSYYDSATNVSIWDDSTANYLVNNYLWFYGIYKDYVTGNLTVNDSANIQIIAGECPLIYGSVVYRARGLYTAVFNQLQAWNDDYCSGVLDSTVGSLARKGNINNGSGNDRTFAQNYKLAPNPNNGSFVLTQLHPDTKPVRAEIWNTLGQNVYNADLSFNSGIINLKLSNFVSGLYMLRLTDSQNRLYNIKFIIE